MNKMDRDAKAAKAKLAKFEQKLEGQLKELHQKRVVADRAEAEADYDAGYYEPADVPEDPMDGIELDWGSVHVSDSALDTNR